MRNYALLKVVSILSIIIWGFLQPAMFQRCLTQQDFAFLTAVFGFSVFLDFFDFGVNKPVYADIRKRYVDNEVTKEELIAVVRLYALILLLVIVCFTTFIFIFSFFFQNEIFKWILILLSFNIVITIFFSYVKYFLFAIELFILFEKLDIFRKISNTLTILLLLIDSSYFLTVILNLLSFGLIFFFIFKKLKSTYNINTVDVFNHFKIKRVWFTFLTYSKKAKYAFFHTFNVSLMYNIGFIFFPIFLTNDEFIQFGLWYKISYGVSMFVVALSDLSIHHITRAYIKKDNSKALKYFLMAFVISVFFVVSFFICFILFKSLIFKIWMDGAHEFSLGVSVTLLIFFIARCLQYMSDTLLLSLGGFFKRSTYISLIYTVLTFLTILSLLFFDYKLSILLLFYSIILVVDGFTYFVILVKKLSVKNG